MGLLLLLLYRRFIAHLPWMKYAIRGSIAFILGSFVLVTLATFLQCRPFHLYWQLNPQPGQCVKGYLQTTIQCVTNIITDLIIMGIDVREEWRQSFRKKFLELSFRLYKSCRAWKVEERTM
ncbi:hypothetical protein BDZ85DRAFT_105451 [Elsinoe ampelina]|uniref:Rhodopsin domain-containing protein n=1 Tax=Elsinoe ampelina TaxID=302913 RepID=A0A6A6FYU2_9PEZI|nr:hypothetical protein BDZ85DRAFT_105451 [Elsinoe ampelina]